MSPLLFTLPELFNSYKCWVSDNPQLASDLETTVKWISYFIAGRVNNSSILSELVFSLSNLLVFVNDQIINNARELKPVTSGDNLKIWLTVLEYSQVFVEITAQKLWGTRGKWIVILALQLAKCTSRLALLLVHKENIIQNPPVSPLKRSDLLEKAKHETNLHSMAFTLKRSGRVIRRINAAPPIHCRNWKPPLHSPNNNAEEDEDEEKSTVSLCKKQLIAEVLYIAKPLVHLCSLQQWGSQAWRPWLVALGVDLMSLHLYKSRENKMELSTQQRLELSRRTVALLMYFLRSPFYEKYSRNHIQALLHSLSHNVPLARMLCSPLAQYIPVWQKTYFYTWST